MNIDLDQAGDTPAHIAQRAIFEPVFGQELPERPSDIHVDVVVSRSEARVRYRAFGELHMHPRSTDLPISEIIVWLTQWTSSKNGAHTFSDNGRLTQSGKTYHLRVSRIGDSQRFSFVFRIVDKFSALPNSLEWPTPEAKELIRGALSMQSGLIVITGPTGAGKTTLAYNLLNSLDRNRLNVRTLEEPVEYALNGVTQLCVNAHEWEPTLKHMLRCDPDVVMMGDIDVGGRSEIAAAAAASGTLVLATKYVQQTPGDLASMDAFAQGIMPGRLHEALAAIIGVRLVKHSSGRKRLPLVSVYLRGPDSWRGVSFADAARHAIAAGWLKPEDGAEFLSAEPRIGKQAFVAKLEAAVQELEHLMEWLPLLREYEQRGVPAYRLAEILRSHGLHVTPAFLLHLLGQGGDKGTA